ncbi:uncharacterized protein LOC141883790 isoform X1 [Acropora palmata]|uniref:uncharacterized protein LOC141883790 isoform X1 n=1 Tax=Acropora palmata TaxID=6131 RepID=UPI003DA0DC99
MKTYAVVISLSKAHHQNHTSKVYCLRLKHQGNLEEARPCGHPFRLHAEGNRFIIRNDFLRDEAIDVGKVIIIVLSSNGCRFLSNTDYHLSIPRIMQGIRFDDLQSAVAYRGIKEAFPYATIYNSSIGQNSPGPNQKHALVSVHEILLKDNNLEAVTRLMERISVNNRSRNDFQNSSIQEKKLSIRKPMSEEDVGDLILISFDSDGQGPYWGTCAGILLSGVSTEPKHYKLDSCPRGYCLIINNMSFDDEELNRQCAIHDEQNLHALFENDLHFLVHIVNDLQNFQMEDICTEYSKYDHSKFDAFVCIVMSHGDIGDKIIGVKGRTIGIEQLMSKFTAKRCPTLANKPKVFFIQACRGPAEDEFFTQSKDHMLQG